VKGKPTELDLQDLASGEREPDSQPENGDPFNVTTPTDEEAKRELWSNSHEASSQVKNNMNRY
jgi:hypothetical protein